MLRALALLEVLGQELLGPSEALPLAEALLPVLRAALPGGYAPAHGVTLSLQR